VALNSCYLSQSEITPRLNWDVIGLARLHRCPAWSIPAAQIFFCTVMATQADCTHSNPCCYLGIRMLVMLPDIVCRPAWSAFYCLVHLGLQSPHCPDFQPCRTYVSAFAFFNDLHSSLTKSSNQNLSCCGLWNYVVTSPPRKVGCLNPNLQASGRRRSKSQVCWLSCALPGKNDQKLTLTNTSDRLWHSLSNSAQSHTVVLGKMRVSSRQI